MNVTYKGRVPNTPLCIDDFHPSVVQAYLDTPLAASCPLLFFLSHLHADHTRGLSPSWQHGAIHTTHANRQLAISRFGIPPHRIVALHYNTPTTLPLTPAHAHHQPHPATHLTVTLLPVYHCPGACMLLLDGYWGRVVYTGDMRWLPGTGLGGEGAALLSRPIDVLYLDNTYADARYDRFLSREAVVQAVVAVIEAHGGGEACDVLINSDLLGKEDVLVMVARRCRCLVAVEADKYAMLRALYEARCDLNESYAVSAADVAECEQKEERKDAGSVAEEERLDAEALSYPSWFYRFTTNRAETFFHVAPKRLLNKKHVEALNETCTRAGRRPVVAIHMSGWAIDSQRNHLHGAATSADAPAAANGSETTPTAAHCTSHPLSPLSPSPYCSGDGTHQCGIHHLPYSSHSSYTELQAFLSHVRPRSILPISAPLTPAPLYSTYLDGRPPTAFSVPDELLRASLRDGEWMRRAGRLAGHLEMVRRRRSDGWSGGKRRRAFALEADEKLDELGTGQQQEEAEDDVLMTEEKAASAELDLTVDERQSPAMPSQCSIEFLISSLSSDEVQVLSPPSPGPSSFHSLDDPVRHFSLRVDPTRCHLISRLSLTDFHAVDIPPLSPLPCSPPCRSVSNPSAVTTLAVHTASLPVRRLPAFLTQSVGRRREARSRPDRFTPHVAATPPPQSILHPSEMTHPWSRFSLRQWSGAFSSLRHRLPLYVVNAVPSELDHDALCNVTSAVNNRQCLMEQHSDAPAVILNAASCRVSLADVLEMPPLEPA